MNAPPAEAELAAMARLGSFFDSASISVVSAPVVGLLPVEAPAPLGLGDAHALALQRHPPFEPLTPAGIGLPAGAAVSTLWVAMPRSMRKTARAAAGSNPVSIRASR